LDPHRTDFEFPFGLGRKVWKGRHAQAQSIAALRQVETGRTGCPRKCVWGQATIDVWKASHGRLAVSAAVAVLDDEDSRLKRLVTDLSWDQEMSKAGIANAAAAPPAARIAQALQMPLPR
jgi:hypothetical protein